MEEQLSELNTEISPVVEMAKMNSENVKVINRKKIKIKQGNSGMNSSCKKTNSAIYDKSFYTERRQTPETTMTSPKQETQEFNFKNNCEN